MTNADSTQIFELSRDEEWDEFINWANKLDGGGSALPPEIRVGDVVIRRPDGVYQVYRLFDREAARSEGSTSRNDEYRRMEILRIIAITGDVSTEVLQKLDDWVSGGQSA